MLPETVLDAALRVATELHGYVFPVDHPELPHCAGLRTGGHDPATCTKRGKHPCVKFSTEATITRRDIMAAFAGSTRNYGVATRRSRLLVIDEDTATLADFAATIGAAVPETFTVSTGRGQHLWFRLPHGVELTNARGRLPAGIDVRAGSDGYVIGPGSVHANGRVYTATWDRRPAAAPQWLIDALVVPAALADESPDGAASPTAEEAGTPVPAAVAERIAASLAVGADRSDRFHALVGACKRAGMSRAAATSALTPWCAAHQKYVGREAQEVDRCWPKVEGPGKSIGDAGPAKGERGPSQASLLREMALERYTFACDVDASAYAVPRRGPRVARMLRGGRTSLRAELAKAYADACGGTVPSQSALADAMTALEGEAAAGDPVPLALRVAAHDGALLLDLGGADGRVVQIDAEGWRVLDRSPILFRRTALTGVLPEPTAPGSLKPLRDRANVTEADWPLVPGFLVHSLIPDVPHPVLALLGEQGTGKSTVERNLVTVIDPSPAPTRAAPRDVEQWTVAAAGSWVVGLDNLSGIQPWLSDVLCRAVTGDGMVRRQLYTDAGLSVLAFRRVVIVNGIDLGALRGDLSERLLTIELERIPAQRRRTAGSVELTPAEHAEVLGGLLDLTSRVLAELPNVHLDEMPRMADFALTLAALDRANGWSAAMPPPSGASGAGPALARYLGQGKDLAGVVVEADEFAAAVRDFADAQKVWVGPAGALLTGVARPDRVSRAWPTSATAAANALKRAAPALRELGYEIEHNGKGTGGARSWTLKCPEMSGESAPLAPPAPPQGADQREHSGAMPPPSGASGATPREAPLKAPLARQGSDQQKGPPSGASGASGAPAPAFSVAPPCPDCGWSIDSTGHLENCERTAA